MMETTFAKNLLIPPILLAFLLPGCSDNEPIDKYQAVSYTESDELYCIASSGSRINIADMIDGGECGENFAKQGDLYDNIGNSSSFSAPPQEPDCVTQVAYSWDSDGATFLFIAHSLGEDGLEILKPGESAIKRRELRTDSTCFIDFWVLSEIKEGDVFEIRLTDRTIPITIGDITSRGGGGTSGLEPIVDEIRIGSFA